MLSAAVTLEGFVTSSIWTLLSSNAATAAYVRPPVLNMAMSRAPESFTSVSPVMLSVAVRLSNGCTVTVLDTGVAWLPSASAQ